MENEILNEAFERLKNEKLILIDVAQGIKTNELTKKYGLF